MRAQHNLVQGLDWDPTRANWTSDDWRRHGRGVLEGEEDSEIGGRTSRAMEERFAGILAAMRVDADEVLSNDEPGVRDVSPTRIPLPASPTLPVSPSMHGHTHAQLPISPLYASSDLPRDGLPFPVLQAPIPPHAYTVEGAPYAYTTDEGHYLPNEPSYQSLMRPPNAVLARNISTGRRTSPGPDAGAWLGGRDHSEFGVGGYQGREDSLFRPLSNPQSQSLSHSQYSHSHSLGRSGSQSLSHSRSQSTGFGGPTRSGSEEPLLSHGGVIGSSSGTGFGGGNVNVQAGAGSRSNASSSSHGHILVAGQEKRGSRGSVPPTSFTFRSKEVSKKSQSSPTETHDDRPGGMRAFFGRLRGGKGSNSATASLAESGSDMENGTNEKRASISSFASMNNHSVKQGISPTMPPLPPLTSLPPLPPPPEPVFSFVLSNPDSRPSSAFTNTSDPCDVRENLDPQDTEFRNSEVYDAAPLPMPAWPWMPSTVPLPSPPPEDSLRFRGLLDPELAGRRGIGRGLGGEDGGRSVASLRDFEDYSRPIGGMVNNRMYSTTTFDTQDTQETQDAKADGDVPEKDERNGVHS
ncbi:hypothetical protein SERLA73DRAFT_174694 [Serpula lacrymans var. lacrymans S7.3]|uniref:Uncharacterized protein n=2 Tax=Serpula lacrymans var. lacrymans TaxID=341189 RepID=F8PJN3_SERL3|nr:uncharacterized protein SERLADRAFT_456335 [Serpula lacrymans var. lacrymans S7.9]EGO03234.1 hypothetical protein SERLA73DRAFT_174694 [Serpula lacrymans var. lacrymans S7.3]EGO29017.1 hypothetical protein SERLADRAFT_456335 [Serpula lacrymans var. lacrymans S7.9]